MSLTSPRFAANDRLQRASENKPALHAGEPDKEAVQILQQALLDLGYEMPDTTKKTGEPDGLYGGETAAAVKKFEDDQNLKIHDSGVAGREVLGRLDELYATESGGPPPNLRGFSAFEEGVLRGDVARARLMCLAAMNVLAPNLAGGLDPEVVKLLQDCFGVDGSDPNDLTILRQVFAGFTPRMGAADVTRTGRGASDPAHLNYDAFVEFKFGVPLTNEIFIRQAHFSRSPQERACNLIHEYVHLVVNGPGHPGIPPPGDASFPERVNMGVPDPQSFSNAYCYDRFAKWLQDVLPKLQGGPGGVRTVGGAAGS